MMKKSFWYNSDQNGDLLKPRTGHGQYVVDIDNMLFAISGLSNCTVSTYRVFLQCTMCTLFSLMPLYPDMEFVQKFTPPDFKVKNFTPSISPYFNSFSGKKHKK